MTTPETTAILLTAWLAVALLLGPPVGWWLRTRSAPVPVAQRRGE